jgi:hypothetical protein
MRRMERRVGPGSPAGYQAFFHLAPAVWITPDSGPHDHIATEQLR